MTLRTHASLAALALTALLAGCSSTPLEEPAKVETATASTGSGTSGTSTGAATTGQTAQSQVSTVDLERQKAEQEAALAASLPRVLYFDFDSFVLRDEYKPAIDGYSRLLRGDATRKLALEGHADERGGREYNLALGQKRAESVARALELLGVSTSQLEAVSFGEERPADPGHDEAAYAKNRRVEMKAR
jgi:peptidoglycan-associated lipoprotein